MQMPIMNRDAFPAEVLELLQAFDRAGFFEDSMLIGSWVMPLYRQAFGMPYSLRTLDIDFAVRFAAREREAKTDIYERKRNGRLSQTSAIFMCVPRFRKHISSRSC